MRVVFWEEPIYTADPAPKLHIERSPEGVLVAQPHLPWGIEAPAAVVMQRSLLDDMIRELRITTPILWYYTPQALAFSGHLSGRPTVYDCMDELSAFAGADPALPERERELLQRAKLVFTGGQSLFESKRALHPSVHAFPSGVDVAHFLPARNGLAEPADLAGIPRPRAGFFGVLDERLDRELLAEAADRRPEMQFVMVGPLAKIDEADLPRRPNIHYLGPKSYAELPAYVGHWDVAMMPFALNEATKFISPTKTPEYLAAGRPVVSTPITDVVRTWGRTGFVQIAGTPDAFAEALDRAVALPPAWLEDADAMLREMSWDQIWARMHALVQAAVPLQLLARRVIGSRPQYDHLIVGAGFAGAVLAERLAAGSGRRVLLIDRRPHIGGNAYDRLDEAGVLIHPYGPHIFHTNSQAVLDYLSRFTGWRPYEHRVLARVRDMLLPIPINRTTVNRFFGVDLTQEQVEAFLRSKAEQRDPIRTSADVVLGAVGRELYEAFFQGYTRKQWGLDPSELDKSVTARVPTRTNDDDRYFSDRFQCMPLHGYTRMFEAMVDHPNITVATSTEYTEVDPASYDHLVFTGPVDEFFDYRYGKLPYRSLQFRHETHDVEQFQPVAVVNYPSPDVPHTRITEFKHLTGQRHAKTSICYEYPSADGDPYYPVPREENAALYQRYKALADATPGVSFVGRLATYKYYNMDQVVGQALATYERLAGRKRTGDRDVVPAAAAE
ncbi:MAG TPA: UDP-galactopyranose mutase [Acetobacteraceae bacterium]|nr:UDP-galactopyranose mutase [Acetobacteraceae bacterium]